MTTMARMRGLAVAALVATTGACSQLGSVGDVLGGVLGTGNGGTSEVSGEVRGVDTRNQVIQIRTSDGRTGEVMYDGNTRVVWQNREYSPTSLEAGDGVTMRLQQDANGRLYTDYITVTYDGSPDNGTGSVGGVFSLSGSVGAVDHSRGTFELRQSGSGTLLVTMPYDATTSERSRFNSLRTGDWVNISARQVSETRFELDTFR